MEKEHTKPNCNGSCANGIKTSTGEINKILLGQMIARDRNDEKGKTEMDMEILNKALKPNITPEEKELFEKALFDLFRTAKRVGNEEGRASSLRL